MILCVKGFFFACYCIKNSIIMGISIDLRHFMCILGAGLKLGEN